MVDLSLTGIRIETPCRLSRGETHVLELRHHDDEVHVTVEVKWVRQEGAWDDGRPRFLAGVAFQEVHREDSGGIWQWILPETEA